MALLKENLEKEKVLKIELPDGTEGEIPISKAEERTEIHSGFWGGGIVHDFGLMGDKKRKYNLDKKKKKKK